jgi:hypothetical protein
MRFSQTGCFSIILFGSQLANNALGNLIVNITNDHESGFSYLPVYTNIHVESPIHSLIPRFMKFFVKRKFDKWKRFSINTKAINWKVTACNSIHLYILLGEIYRSRHM